MGLTKKNITFAPKLPNGDENNLLNRLMSQTTTLNRKPIIDGLTLPKANKTRPPRLSTTIEFTSRRSRSIVSFI